MVVFREEDHVYINIYTGQKYISATTLIGEYKQPFDKDFWSEYKAVERFVIESSSKKDWENWKSSVGFKNVIKEFKKKATPDKIQKVQEYTEDILREWEYEKNIACFNGTNFHKAQEHGWLAKPEHKVKDKVYSVGEAFTNKKSTDYLDEVYNIPKPIKDLKDGVYSELTLWSNYYKVAGQADIVFIETIDGVRYVDIDDYKTNKEIKTVSYKSRKGYEKMKSPLNSVMNCNYCHYNLQLSLYLYLLELEGFVPRNIEFQHWSNIGSKEDPKYVKNKVYQMEYLQKQVIAMLTHHKRQKRKK
jgi:hypothetical protein